MNNMNNNNWTMINNKNRKEKKQEENTQIFRTCGFFAQGNCRNRNCKLGLHLSEDERNKDERIQICNIFNHSLYQHSIIECIQKNGNNGICNHCAYGNCNKKNKCPFRHDVESRYANNKQYVHKQKEYEYYTEKKILESKYTVCYEWSNTHSCTNQNCIYIHPYTVNTNQETNNTNQETEEKPIITNVIDDNTPVYKMYIKPKNICQKQKITKKIETTEEIYYDHEGNECININTIEVEKTIKIDDKIIKKTKTKSLKKSKEVTSFEEFYFDDLTNQKLDHEIKNII